MKLSTPNCCAQFSAHLLQWLHARIWVLPILASAALALATARVAAQDAPSKPAAKQADLASRTVKFGTVSKEDESYKKALESHAMAAALKQANADGAFKGKVARIFEPPGGALAIMNFDLNYRSALTALVRKENFDKFPALTNLVGKEVLVTGRFTVYQGRGEVVLTNAAQVKLVE